MALLIAFAMSRGKRLCSLSRRCWMRRFVHVRFGGERQRAMKRRRLARVLVAMAATMMLLAVGVGSAHAVFPNFSGCTVTDVTRETCIDIQNRSGNLNIKGFNVPLGESLEIRGKLSDDGTGRPVFSGPTGTTGFFSTPVPVPGGLLGIEWLPGNSVLALAELVGPSSGIIIDPSTLTIRMPIRVRLENLLLGMSCQIGTNSNPVPLTLIAGTTSPPPPNGPISGRRGTVSQSERAIMISGNVNVENSFAVPGATSCGFGLGLINTLVNLKLGLPSAAGNNSMEIVNDVAIGH
ncbi:MAG: hypothetical protein ACJ76L_10240 [Conexibacter sp.]